MYTNLVMDVTHTNWRIHMQVNARVIGVSVIWSWPFQLLLRPWRAERCVGLWER